MAVRKNEARWVEKSTRWRIDVQKDGVRRSFYSATAGKKGKAEAERKADKWLETGSSRENVRFGALWAEHLERVKSTTGTSNYKQTEYFGRCWLLPGLEHKWVVALTEQDWQNCIDRGFKGGLSKKTLTSIRTTISVFCRFAKKNGIPMERPEDITIPRGAPVGKKRILQPDDLKTLFSTDLVKTRGQVQPYFYVPAFRFLVLLGLRPGELCGLQNSDLSGNTLTVQRSINSYGEITTGKNENAQRSIILGRHQLAILEQQRENLKRHHIISKWLFPDRHGNAMSSVCLYGKWKLYRKQHNISCSLYEMRHTLISLAKSDVPEQLIKMVVGHSGSMDTFGVYGHEVDGEKQRAANMLDGVFDRVLSQ